MKNQMEFPSFNQGSHSSYAQLLPKKKREKTSERIQNLDNDYLEELQRL